MVVTFVINAFMVVYNLWLRRLEMDGQARPAGRIDSILVSAP